MGAIIDSVVKFEGEDAGFFLKDVTENESVTSFGFDVIDEVTDSYIYLNTEFDKITKKKTTCGYTNNTDGADIYRKKLTLVELQAYKEQCYKVFDNTVFRKKLKRGSDAADMTDGEIGNMLKDFVTPVIARDAIRILFLGDTAVGNSDYNQLDGIYKVLAGGAATADDSGVKIPDAGAITDAMLSTDVPTAGSVIGQTEIEKLFARVYAAQHRKLRQVADSEKRFIVTGSIYDAWADFIISKNGALESSMSLLQNGVSVLKYRGIPIIPVRLVDEYLAADFYVGSPGTTAEPNRMILTKADNHVLALDVTAPENEVRFWFDENTEKTKFRATYQMAYTYKYPEYMVIAGF